MGYEIKSVDMIRARNVSNQVIDGILNGTLEIKSANVVNNATNNIIRALGTDLKARLALPELLETEAKLIAAQSADEPQAIEKQ
jgi:hypothetical protein